jgi:hypothetical protein
MGSSIGFIAAGVIVGILALVAHVEVRVRMGERADSLWLNLTSSSVWMGAASIVALGVVEATSIGSVPAAAGAAVSLPVFLLVRHLWVQRRMRSR